MNEQAINDAYSLFSSKGYNGSVEDFKNLIATNPNALGDAYKLFASKGYNGSIDGFSELMGLKKKNHPFLLLKRALWRQLRKLVHWRRQNQKPLRPLVRMAHL